MTKKFAASRRWPQTPTHPGHRQTHTEGHRDTLTPRLIETKVVLTHVKIAAFLSPECLLHVTISFSLRRRPHLRRSLKGGASSIVSMLTLTGALDNRSARGCLHKENLCCTCSLAFNGAPQRKRIMEVQGLDFQEVVFDVFDEDFIFEDFGFRFSVQALMEKCQVVED